MCHSRANHSKINRIHERYPRIIYSDKTSSFEALLEKDGSATIHTRNFQLLATEMYKASKGLSAPIITELFEKMNKHQYNLRHNSRFTIPAVNSVYHGTGSVSFVGPKIWDVLSDRLKKLDSPGAFKTAIKGWKPEKCPYRCPYALIGVYLRKPELLQIGKELNSSNFCFIFYFYKMM